MFNTMGFKLEIDGGYININDKVEAYLCKLGPKSESTLEPGKYDPELGGKAFGIERRQDAASTDIDVWGFGRHFTVNIKKPKARALEIS